MKTVNPKKDKKYARRRDICQFGERYTYHLYNALYITLYVECEYTVRKKPLNY